MINLRLRPKEPAYLRSETVSNLRRQLDLRVAAGDKLQSTDFRSYWLCDSVRNPLWEAHHRKCAYCERKRDKKREADVDHFRPKAEVTDDPNHPGYWWMAYEWENYLFACRRCNQDNKKNHFPLLENSPRASHPDDDISQERPVLLNPFDDDPEVCISYDWKIGAGLYVKEVGTDTERRGAETINILGLNDAQLMEERAQVLPLLKLLATLITREKLNGNHGDVVKLASDITDQTSAEQSFAGFRRAYFKDFGLGEYVATD